MVTVLFKTESHYPVNKQKITDAITNALDGHVKRNSEVSITIVGDRKMLQLNSTFRNRKHTTDVLSFPLNESSSPNTPFIEPPDKVLRLGDIVVSYPQAVREAADANKFVDDQIIFLALHGLNHLLGIHHQE